MYSEKKKEYENKFCGFSAEDCTRDRNLQISQIHIKKKENKGKHRLNKIGISFAAMLILLASASMVYAQPTVVFVGDAKPSIGKDNIQLIGDLNQVIPLSPTGSADATVWIGDNNHISGSVSTDAGIAGSNVKNVPAFFVIGNHDIENTGDLPSIRNKFYNYPFSPSPGPAGTKETTYSFNVGDMHVISLNQYWDGNANGKCDWSTPGGGLNADDSCNKYSSGNGGFIPDGLFTWLENDLKSNTKPWVIVTGHEPLYPWGRHIGDSLDENKTNRDKLENMFIKYNVTAFIGGHSHVAGLKTGLSGIANDHVIQGNVGAIGANVGTEAGGDNFATIIYTYVDNSGNFVIEQKNENPTWSTPKDTKLTVPPIAPSSNPKLGDVNLDGSITSGDALLYLRFSVGANINPFTIDPVTDDVDCSKPPDITTSDALQVLRKSVNPAVKLGC